MDAVRMDGNLIPEKDGKNTITKCNMAVYALAQKLGLAFFWKHPEERVMLANEMVDFMLAHPAIFSRFQDHQIAWGLANMGYLIIAAKKDDPHGHVAPVYPSVGMVTSGKWNAAVPYVSNVGVRNDVMGVNFAFGEQPDYYLIF
jgi:hypothetical protein